MKPFTKKLIEGALGLGALFLVGKVCYEVGKNVGDIERQLADSKAEEDADKFNDLNNVELDIPTNCDDTVKVRHIEKFRVENNVEPVTSSFVDKIRNAKMFLTLRKVFDKRDRPKGILGSLLTDPDGAKIEAIVKDGGVQISVKPRAE